MTFANFIDVRRRLRSTLLPRLRQSPQSLLASTSWAAVTIIALAAAAPAAAMPTTALAAPVPAPEPELHLSIALELSTEQSNSAALVGRIIRTEVLESGDKLDISQRVSRLRKELGANYISPAQTMGFQLASNEITLSETSRYITNTKLLTTAQAAYRFYWSRAATVGVWGIGAGAEALRIDTEPDSAPYLREFVQRHGKNSRTIPVTAFWLSDRRQANRILPEGHLDRLNTEWGTGLGSVSYAKIDFQHSSYFAMSPRLSTGFSANLGAIRGLGGDLTPLTKRYFGGGVGTVRGYEASALTPTDTAQSGIGANRQAVATVEALWHAFSVGETPVIFSAFADAGKFADVGSSKVANSTSVSAKSYGLGISMPVRIGLVRFSFAKPVDAEWRTQRFQFEARANW